jgi:predicted transcriptional regulator of viral defense system
MKARQFIDNLASNGRYHFSLLEVVTALQGSPETVRAQLLRLKNQGIVAEPSQGFMVVVPHEYRQLGCLPAEQFVPQLLEAAKEPYYFALLTAAERHGAAHQRPQSAQVMVRKNRSPIICGKVRVEFIARSDLAKMPVSTFNTPRGRVQYSTPELTALELVGYPKHAGGLGNIATILQELADEIDATKLGTISALSPLSWSQRLGYLLETLGFTTLADALKPLVLDKARSYTPLRRAAKTTGARRNTEWKVIINAEVEPDQ